MNKKTGANHIPLENWGAQSDVGTGTSSSRARMSVVSTRQHGHEECFCPPQSTRKKINGWPSSLMKQQKGAGEEVPYHTSTLPYTVSLTKDGAATR